MTELWRLSAVELVAGYRAGSFTPVEVVDAVAARAEEVDGRLHALVHAMFDRARDEAGRLGPAAGGRPLHGVPVVVKDLFDVAGTVTGAGSLVLPGGGAPATADAAAVARLRAAGALVVGRSRTHEYAWGITTQHHRLGGARSPWDPDRIAGGSSGGSAAAVAAGIAPLALGTDTGGSIRVPAAFCGAIGMKPTFGAVPLDGAVALAPSLDHAGPIARTVGDARLALTVLAGHDVAAIDAASLRVGVLADPSSPGLAPAVAAALDDAVAALGGHATTVAWPSTADLVALYAVLQPYEAHRHHHDVLGTWPARAADYGPDVRARLERGATVSAADYEAATEERRRLTARIVAAFDDVDVVVSPVCAAAPSPAADPDHTELAGRRVPLRDVVLPFTVPQDLAGLPACAVPMGVDEHGLPVAVQVAAAPGRDDLALAAAELVHQASPLRGAWPAL